MAQTSSQSVLIVGGGIVGLCVATVLRARGYAVTVVARDSLTGTASAIAAGMIAPAMEAMSDPEPRVSYARLKEAQTAWMDQLDLWPRAVQNILSAARASRSLYFSDSAGAAATEDRFRATGADFKRLSAGDARRAGFNSDALTVFSLSGDWLVEASAVLAALRSGLVANDVTWIDGKVSGVGAHYIALAGGKKLTGDHVVVAAGYGGRTLAHDVPVLSHLSPIKGHLLDLESQSAPGVVRSVHGYLAAYGRHAKFGASMQAGQGDLDIEPAVVADLTRRGEAMGADMAGAVPRVGIRASTPDGWPMIGRDATSGVWMAVGMRRNGFVLAPLAARAIADGLDSLSPDAALGAYDPNRFDAV